MGVILYLEHPFVELTFGAVVAAVYTSILSSSSIWMGVRVGAHGGGQQAVR
jgi:hypothetical protein